MQSPKIRIFYTKGRKLSAVHNFRRPFNREDLQVNQMKHKQRPPEAYFATLTPDNQIKHVQYSMKLETVLPSQKHGCHLNSAGSISVMINSQFVFVVEEKRPWLNHWILFRVML